MADGRTPTMELDNGPENVLLEDVRSAFPFPAIGVRRKFEERSTRDSLTGPRKLIRVFDRYNLSEESIRVTVPYLSEASYLSLRNIIEADPPTVNVTYLHLTAEPFVITELTPVPDDFDWLNDKSFQASFTLLRETL